MKTKIILLLLAIFISLLSIQIALADCCYILDAPYFRDTDDYDLFYGCIDDDKQGSDVGKDSFAAHCRSYCNDQYPFDCGLYTEPTKTNCETCFANCEDPLSESLEEICQNYKNSFHYKTKIFKQGDYKCHIDNKYQSTMGWVLQIDQDIANKVTTQKEFCGPELDEFAADYVQYSLPAAEFSYEVNWDGDPEDCELLGGKWLRDSEQFEVPNHGLFTAKGDNYGNEEYGSYRCCGDDYMWIYNTQYEYKSHYSPSQKDALRKEHKLCLYYDEEDPEHEMDIALEGEEGSGPYICEPLYWHTAYDPNVLNIDYEYWLNETHIRKRTDPFFFQPYSDNTKKQALLTENFEAVYARTDIGKWSNKDMKDPLFCTYKFDEQKGDTFEWKTLNKAADESRVVCRNFNGSWTGQYCCGTNYDYQNHKYSYESFSDPQEIYYMGEEGETDIILDNPACLQANITYKSENKTYNFTTMGKQEHQGYNINILNGNGTLYTCNIEDSWRKKLGKDYHNPSQDLIPSKNNVKFCTIINSSMPGELIIKDICVHRDYNWHNVEASKYITDILGFNGDWNITDSAAGPWITENNKTHLKQECCFSNSCWNGTKCVEHGYHFEHKIDPDNNLIDHYICDEGEWKGPLDADYDWLHNSYGYCVKDYSCYCTGDMYGVSGCGDYTTANGCTNIENFFTQDHYCDYFEEQEITSAWTSRTKLIAEQLLELAQGQSYTLYCDKAENTLNYITPLEINNETNSFCILNMTNNIILGVSFIGNTPMYFHPKLFGSDGFIEGVLDEDDIGKCDYAFDHAFMEQQGSYKKCMSDNNKYWFNNKTKSFIYSKYGIDVAGNELPIPNHGSYQQLFDNYIDKFVNFNKQFNSSIKEAGLTSMAFVEYASDFSKIYIADIDNKKVFGIVERKYDTVYTDNPRNLLAVQYYGFDVDCDSVIEAYEDSGQNVFCSDYMDKTFVFSKTTQPEFEYWRDLTSTLRIG